MTYTLLCVQPGQRGAKPLLEGQVQEGHSQQRSVYKCLQACNCTSEKVFDVFQSQIQCVANKTKSISYQSTSTPMLMTSKSMASFINE